MNPDGRLRVLVVDDHDLVQVGLRALVSRQPWVERYLTAVTAAEGLELARRYEPHVALVDVVLGEESGGDLCREIRESVPHTRVLLISGSSSMSPSVARAAGASGFIPKSFKGVDVANAVRMVGLGMAMFPSLAEEPPPRLLTQREHEVLELLVEGKTNREIGEALYLSESTVKEHASALYKKVNARNRAEAVLRAQRMGILS
jgi:DNA-binding NarL/FixJ family response regulator